MKKTKIKQNSFVVVASMIQTTPQNLNFVFDDQECQALADRFDLPKVLSFSADLTLYRDEFVHIKGQFEAMVIYQSVISLDEFESPVKAPIDVLFSENPPQKSDEIIDKIERGRIDLREVLFEQFGLSLSPFPKKEDEQNGFVYQEVSSPKENPFEKLKTRLQK